MSQNNYNKNQNPRKDFVSKNRKDESSGFNYNANEYIPIIIPLMDKENHEFEVIKKAVQKIESTLKNISDLREDKVKAHQIRNIYNLIKKIKNREELLLNKPRLAYIGARQATKSGKLITGIILGLVDQVIEENSPGIFKKKLNGLIYIMESIVAYHKFYITN